MARADARSLRRRLVTPEGVDLDVELGGAAKLLKALGLEADAAAAADVDEKKEARPPLEKKRSSWLWGR